MYCGSLPAARGWWWPELDKPESTKPQNQAEALAVVRKLIKWNVVTGADFTLDGAAVACTCT